MQPMINKKTLCAAVIAVLLIIPCMTVFTSASAVDTQRQVSLAIKDVPLADITFSAYLVAQMDGEGSLTVSDAFADSAIELNEDTDIAQLSGSLVKYVLKNKITADATAVSDKLGAASFKRSDLKQGLYLITAQRVVKDGKTYCVSPFMASLPYIYENTVHYDVIADAKFDLLPSIDLYTVYKVWSDVGVEDKRPQSIDISLYCDGEVYEQITLPHNGAWKYEWKDLPSDHVWWVEENDVVDYSFSVTEKGSSFTVINTYTGSYPPPQEDIPSTGQLWWPVPILLCAGLVLIVCGLIRRKSSV